MRQSIASRDGAKQCLRIRDVGKEDTSCSDIPNRSDPDYAKKVRSYPAIDFTAPDAEETSAEVDARAEAEAKEANAEAKLKAEAIAEAKAEARIEAEVKAEKARAKVKKALEEELETCRGLTCAWSDAQEVVKDCNELLAAAEKEIGDEKGNLQLAEGKLRQVRQRLAQASNSDKKKCWAWGLLGWHVFVLAICMSLLALYHLLPGLSLKPPID
ncbi:MAG: hypothetical protein NTU41_03675, partial [Chloroflexi bacterium]|nr:hypothetical protein [Chloroflexota bacterium]